MNIPQQEVLTISPARSCWHCPRITDIAVLDYRFDDAYCHFRALCPLHCYPFEATPVEQDAALHRFLYWAYSESLSVLNILPVEPTSVPGYSLKREVGWYPEDVAWRVRCEMPERRPFTCYLVWCHAENRWHLYELGKLFEVEHSE